MELDERTAFPDVWDEAWRSVVAAIAKVRITQQGRVLYSPLLFPLRKIRALSHKKLCSLIRTWQFRPLWCVLFLFHPEPFYLTALFPGYGLCPQASIPAERIYGTCSSAVYLERIDIRLLDIPPRTSPMEHLSPTRIII